MTRITKRMIRRSHEAQFNGEDYQQAGWEVAQDLKFEPTESEWQELFSEPSPGCDCGFCATAKWEN